VNANRERTFDGVSVKPRPVFEHATQGYGYLPVLVSFRTSRGRAGKPEYLTARLNKLRDGVAGLTFYRLVMSKWHGMDHAPRKLGKRLNSSACD
jgi:hypothetical protein